MKALPAGSTTRRPICATVWIVSASRPLNSGEAPRASTMRTDGGGIGLGRNSRVVGTGVSTVRSPDGPARRDRTRGEPFAGPDRALLRDLRVRGGGVGPRGARGLGR